MPYIQAKAGFELLCDDCGEELKFSEEYLYGRDITVLHVKPCGCGIDEEGR